MLIYVYLIYLFPCSGSSAQPHDGFEEGVRSSAGLQPWHAMAITAIAAIAAIAMGMS